MKEEYKRVQEDAQVLKEDLNDAVRQVKQEILEYATQVADTTSTKLRETGKVARQKGKEIDALAHENVWAVAAVAATVGAVVGALFSRGRRD